MDFDTSALNRLLTLPDDKLWQTICKIASLNGVSISESAPPKEEMARLRGILSSAEGVDYKQALATIEQYKRRG